MKTAIKIEVAQVYLGVVLVGVGAGLYSLSVGLVAAGALLILLGTIGSK